MTANKMIHIDRTKNQITIKGVLMLALKKSLLTFALLVLSFFMTSHADAAHCTPKKLTYYLYIDDFIKSFIQIPTSNVLVDSTTISSSYLAGRAPVYNTSDVVSGTCSASFLCMQNDENIYTDISNYLSVDNGLIVSWLTPTTLLNLELDSIVHGMVTECLVVAYTKIGFNPFYGKTFNMVVSSDDEKIYFTLQEVKK